MRILVRRFQGEFKLGNDRYCYRPTVTDDGSCFLLMCEALGATRKDLAVTAFEQLFRECDLPSAIRSDDGVPFASPNALFNLSKLSVWWLHLGIAIERMRLTLKRGPPARRESTRYTSGRALMPSVTSSMPNGRTRHSPCAALPSSIHPRAGPIMACPRSSIRCTIANC